MSADLRLEGATCAVRAWRMRDLDSLVRHANNPSVARHLRDRFPHPYTRRAGQVFLEYVISSEPRTNLAIEIDGDAVGGIAFSIGTDVERYSAEIGYWVSEACWGRGVGTEALKMVTRYAFDRFNLLRLYALPFAENTASIRVLEKAGYGREGLLRSSSVKYGRPRDQVLYACVNSRWEIPPRG